MKLMKPPLITLLDLPMNSPSAAVRLASRIVLGIEVKCQQQVLGYEGQGAHWSFKEGFKPGEKPTWPEWCRSQAGISDVSAALYFQGAEAVKTRLRCLAKPGSKALLRMMEKKPSTLTAAERGKMIEKIVILGLTKGETMSQLRREFRGVHRPPLGIEERRAPAIEVVAHQRGISLKELHERYPDEKDRNLYAMGRISGCSEEKARLAVVVMREFRRRKSLGELAMDALETQQGKH